MDGGRMLWMMLPFWELPSKLILGFPPCSWAQLVLVFSGDKCFLYSITLINTYLIIGGQEGMDAGGANWITFPFWEAMFSLMEGT
jgi:hypothetical protein